jgi:hypothetical protein
VLAVVLLSGGLDSQLAVCILREQGIEVEALNFKTIFTCCQDSAGQAARDLGVRLTVVSQEDDYLDLVKRPRFGRGKGANPCVDCRIYMFQRARQFMEEIGARFVASGEVIGQRPMSQKRNDLDVIAYHSDLDGLLLRPLSAKLMAPTVPEKEGWVDRERLYAFSGRSRKGLLELGARFGLKHLPAPSSGCALTETLFSKKVFDVLRTSPAAGRWEFELLKVGRHFRFSERTKIVVGRRESDNDQLGYLHRLPDAASTALLTPENFTGPVAMIVGPADPAAVEFAAGLIVRYSKAEREGLQVRLDTGDGERLIKAAPLAAAAMAQTIAN